MTDRVVIRPLAAGDIAAYRALRLAALEESPTSFSASPEEEALLSDGEIAARAVPEPPGIVFGGFADGNLVGMATYIPSNRAKMRHKAVMAAVYVAPEWRSARLGRRLVEAVVAHAARQRVILQCTVTAHNGSARRLYHALGFVAYGLERHSLLVDGEFLDEELLALDLRNRTDSP